MSTVSSFTFDDGYRDNLTEALPILERFATRAIVFRDDGALSPVRPFPSSCSSPTSWSRAPSCGSRADDGSIASTVTARREVYETVRAELKRAGGKGRDARLDVLFDLNDVESPRSDGRFLDWDGVRELDRHPLVTIGAHTRTHPLLTSLGRDEAWDEIASGKRELEDELGHPVEAFAYPYGGNGMAVRRLVDRAGFRWAFTTEPKVVADTRRLRPLRVPRIDMRAALQSSTGERSA